MLGRHPASANRTNGKEDHILHQEGDIALHTSSPHFPGVEDEAPTPFRSELGNNSIGNQVDAGAETTVVGSQEKNGLCKGSRSAICELIDGTPSSVPVYATTNTVDLSLVWFHS